MTERILRLAIQKEGRLYDDSARLLRECDLSFEDARGSRKLKTRCYNFPMEILFLRDDDIPLYVADGVADLGVVGENLLRETGAEVEVLEPLGFSRCKLSIAVPKDSAAQQIGDLAGSRIATSYPQILSNFLKDARISCRVEEISGSVEIAPQIGLADAICDIVGSGSTLTINGLRELAVVMTSEAVLIRSPRIAGEARELTEKLLFRARAVKRATRNKYLVLNAPEAALPELLKLLPGLKSPSVIRLAEPGWCAIHTVVDAEDFWERIDALRAAGAQGIVVSAIEKLIQ